MYSFYRQIIMDRMSAVNRTARTFEDRSAMLDEPLEEAGGADGN
jgi:hypothetical protein